MPTSQLGISESRLLAVETSTALGHTSTVTVLDAAAAPHRIDGALLSAEVRARLDELPVLRQSLVEVPLRLDRPWWRDDPGFDLDYHLRYIAVPDPDDPTSLHELVARIHGRPLDRRRPLWELYLISGLAGGQKALLSKIHLAALGSADGLEISAGLVGATPALRSRPDAAAAPTAEAAAVGDGGELRWRPSRGPTPAEVTLRAWRNALIDPVRALSLVPRRLSRVPGLAAWLTPGLALLNQRTQRPIVMPGQDRLTPRTSFNRRVGPHRRWAPTILDMTHVAAVRRAGGVSTVDVLTTICGGALRWWLLTRDELPRDPLQALVPLSVTDPDAIEGLAGVVVSLETTLERPVDRLASVHEQIGEAVTRHRALPAAEIRGLGGGTPLIGMVASRFLERASLADRLQPPFNTVITSVPGPAEPRYALGAPVEAIHPVLGVVDGVGLHIGAMSIRDRLCVSLVADRDLVPDLGALAERLSVELSLLADALDVDLTRA